MIFLTVAYRAVLFKIIAFSYVKKESVICLVKFILKNIMNFKNSHLYI